MISWFIISCVYPISFFCFHFIFLFIEMNEDDRKACLKFLVISVEEKNRSCLILDICIHYL